MVRQWIFNVLYGTQENHAQSSSTHPLNTRSLLLSKCNGVEWSKDKTQAAESIKWRPQQAYGSNQFLLVQPQTVFSTPKIITLTHR